MSVPKELLSPNKRNSPMPGIGQHERLERHDPSNIIEVGGTYFLWYTEHPPEDGFIGTYVQLATSTDGEDWTVQGTALAAGKPGDWDSQGALTTYVVPHNDRFVMFYTGVGDDYHDANADRRGIGYATSESPWGPWLKHDRPILWPGSDGSWDELCCDDANVIRREGKWWLYYKGRRKGSKPTESRIGVAIADELTGPYQKHAANPLFAGHAFSAWVHREGVAAVEGGVGRPEDRTVLWSPDGLHFEKAGPFNNQSTGFYCPQNFEDGTNPKGVSWGVDVILGQGPRYLVRFDCDLVPRGR